MQHNDDKEDLEPGELELYVLGGLSNARVREIESMRVHNPVINDQILQFQQDLYHFIHTQTDHQPPAWIRSSLRQVWEHLANEEKAKSAAIPQLLSAASIPQDYLRWSTDPTIQPPDEYDNMYFTPLHKNEQGVTLMVWMKNGIEPEVHTKYVEQFLILEGTCEITIEKDHYSLGPGGYLSIPLYHSHWVTVTSEHPCKFILQRLAA